MPRYLKAAVELELLGDQEQTWPMIKFIWPRTFKNLKRNCWKNIWKRCKMLKPKVKILIEEAIMVIKVWVKIWILMFL